VVAVEADQRAALPLGDALGAQNAMVAIPPSMVLTRLPPLS